MHQVRKRFGQHFLRDQSVIDDIVNAINPQPGEHVVEIGPGLGAITLPVLARIKEMDAVEIDRDVIAALKVSAFNVGTLHLHEADVLKFGFGSLRSDTQLLRLIGNLPYNISTPLLFRLIEQREHFLDMHFMLQKEVVDRMAALPDTDDYGRLTVMLAPWLQVTPLSDIGPQAFRPPPRVMSTVVRLVPHATPPFTIHDQEVFANVVMAAFSQRRKTLRNALRSLLSAEQIEAAGIDPGLRAEVLSPECFAALARQVA
ncbi:MAG: 16S rRNA (adenine(1518)-N(6)/adenine(1519)-N(6))-dimethyltransferase RsmA [Steroidobacteraceae bacterium]